jgi:hypothetical protein
MMKHVLGEVIRALEYDIAPYPPPVHRAGLGSTSAILVTWADLSRQCATRGDNDQEGMTPS